MPLLMALLLCLLPLSAQRSTKPAPKPSTPVKKLEQQRNNLLKQIEQTSKALKEVKQTSQEEAKRLQLVKQQVAQRKEVIAVIGQEMQALEGQLDSLGGRIAKLRTRESRLLSEYASSLRAMYRGEVEGQRLLYLLSAKNIKELRLRQRFIAKYARATSEVAMDLRSTRQDIEQTQAKTNQLHQQKAEVRSLRERERQALEAEEGKRSAQINKLKSEERQLAQDLNKQKRQAEQLDSQIQAQIAAEIAAAEAKARKAQEAREARQRRREEARRKARERVAGNAGKKPSPSPTKPSKPNKQDEEDKAEEVEDRRDAEESERRAEEHGGYAMNAGERKLSGSFAQNKGRLPMPVRGRYRMVRGFGTQQHQQHSRIHITNGGIDLRVESDRNAYSVFEGVVSRIFVTPGFGQSVIVRHGNYLTVYSNLSSVRVKSGQRVQGGTALGTINSDNSNGRGNVLHFQLWHERRKQNPSQWVRP